MTAAVAPSRKWWTLGALVFAMFMAALFASRETWEVTGDFDIEETHGR